MPKSNNKLNILSGAKRGPESFLVDAKPNLLIMASEAICSRSLPFWGQYFRVNSASGELSREQVRGPTFPQVENWGLFACGLDV